VTYWIEPTDTGQTLPYEVVRAEGTCAQCGARRDVAQLRIEFAPNVEALTTSEDGKPRPACAECIADFCAAPEFCRVFVLVVLLDGAPVWQEIRGRIAGTARSVD
jgi:hypothetical protein